MLFLFYKKCPSPMNSGMTCVTYSALQEGNLAMHAVGVMRTTMVDRLIIICWKLISIEQDPDMPSDWRNASHRSLFYSCWIMV
jgi:hypothetical protein